MIPLFIVFQHQCRPIIRIKIKFDSFPLNVPLMPLAGLKRRWWLPVMWHASHPKLSLWNSEWNIKVSFIERNAIWGAFSEDNGMLSNSTRHEIGGICGIVHCSFSGCNIHDNLLWWPLAMSEPVLRLQAMSWRQPLAVIRMYNISEREVDRDGSKEICNPRLASASILTPYSALQ